MRKLLIGVAAVLGLVVAAAVMVPLAVPVGVYEGRVAALVKQATGRELKVAGPVKLSVLPALAVEANDVSFGNTPGTRSPDMVAVKQMRVRLRLWPLLHGWDNLSYRPDLAGMLTRTPGNLGAILKSAGGSVGKNLEGVGQTLRGVGQGAPGALNGIFGK
jgi:AsmA family